MLRSHVVKRWAWPITLSYCGPHMLRESRVGHSRRLDPPTKGPTAGTRDLPSNHTWARARVTMPLWVTPRGGCQLCHSRQDMAWRERASGQIRTGVGQLQKDVAPDGISRYLLYIVSRERVGLEKTEREGAGHSLGGGRRCLEEQNDTCLSQEARGEKQTLVWSEQNTWKKIKGGIFKSLPFTCKPQQPRFHCLGGFIRADLGFLLSEIVSKQTHMCSMRDGHSVGSKQNKTKKRGGARCLSSATHHRAFDTASFSFFFF